MSHEEFLRLKPQIISELKQALLDAETKHPGGLQAWFGALAKGPGSE